VAGWAQKRRFSFIATFLKLMENDDVRRRNRNRNFVENMTRYNSHVGLIQLRYLIEQLATFKLGWCRTEWDAVPMAT